MKMRRGWMCVPAALLGAVAGGISVKKIWLEKYHVQETELSIAKQESDLLYTWLLLEQNGAVLEEYFSAHGYKTAAILGMGREGRRFFESLRKSESISIEYGVEIDNFAAVHEVLAVYRLGEDPLPPAECLVVCGLERIAEKAAAAQKEFSGEIVTIAQVLAWLLEQHQIKPWDGAVRGWPPCETVVPHANTKQKRHGDE